VIGGGAQGVPFASPVPFVVDLHRGRLRRATPFDVIWRASDGKE
jgi:hypothetical protein